MKLEYHCPVWDNVVAARVECLYCESRYIEVCVQGQRMVIFYMWVCVLSR